jgi:hypothetical protein
MTGSHPRITSFEASYSEEWGFTMTLYFESKEDFINMISKFKDCRDDAIRRAREAERGG